MRFFRLLSSLILLSFMGGVFWTARAQTAPATPPPASLLDLTTQTYYSLVEKYRDEEQKFVIAQQTYYQLNTLASQDEAIRRAKDVMLTRADLMNTYFTYLHLVTLQTRGVELGDKQQTLNLVAAILSELSAYKDSIPALTTRGLVSQQMEAFTGRQKEFFNAAYAALQVIKIGEIQTAIDTAVLLRNDMETWVAKANISAADRAIKERGLVEAERLLSLAGGELGIVLANHRQRVAQGNLSEQSYHNFQTAVDPIYVELRQAQSFLIEIAKGI